MTRWLRLNVKILQTIVVVDIKKQVNEMEEYSSVEITCKYAKYLFDMYCDSAVRSAALDMDFLNQLTDIIRKDNKRIYHIKIRNDTCQLLSNRCMAIFWGDDRLAYVCYYLMTYKQVSLKRRYGYKKMVYDKSDLDKYAIYRGELTPVVD